MKKFFLGIVVLVAVFLMVQIAGKSDGESGKGAFDFLQKKGPSASFAGGALPRSPDQSVAIPGRVIIDPPPLPSHQPEIHKQPQVGPAISVPHSSIESGQVTITTHEDGQRVETVYPVQRDQEGQPYVNTDPHIKRLRIIGGEDGPKRHEQRQPTEREQECAEMKAQGIINPLHCF